MNHRHHRHGNRQTPQEHWKVKQLARQVSDLQRQVAELREGRDLKRWPAIINELTEAKRDVQAAREALRKVTAERDSLLTTGMLPA